MKKLDITNRTRVKRLPKRASYDSDVIYNILDETFICQVGFKINNHVYIIPTAFGRKNELVYIHGSKNNRMLKSFETGEDICISVTLVDGIVLAKSAFHHSINYRSVILFGKPNKIVSNEEKNKALEIIMDHIIPGRWGDTRKPNAKELKATSVFSIQINEASAKIRTGPPNDDKEDIDLNVWTGVIPTKIIAEEPIKNVNLIDNIPLPDYLKQYVKK